MNKLLTTALTSMFLSMGVATAQTQVKGKVVSQDDGQPVVGATVNVLGTNEGTVTDIDGNFSMTIPNGSAENYWGDEDE